MTAIAKLQRALRMYDRHIQGRNHRFVLPHENPADAKITRRAKYWLRQVRRIGGKIGRVTTAQLKKHQRADPDWGCSFGYCGHRFTGIFVRSYIGMKYDKGRPLCPDCGDGFLREVVP